MVYSKPWEEVVGVFDGIEIVGDQAFVLIGKYCLVFPVYSPEALALGRLDNNWIGRSIGVLRTNDSRRPIVIRKIKKK